MKVVCWYVVCDICVEDIFEFQFGFGEVKFKVVWIGICGSDLYEYLVGLIFVLVGQDYLLSYDKVLIIMGYEYCGIVIELGDGVLGLVVGDWVVIELIFVCGICFVCYEGKYNFCDSLGFVGLLGGYGGFVFFLVVFVCMVYKILDGLLMEQGVLVEFVVVVLYVVWLLKIKVGDMVVVFGVGFIGFLVVEVLCVVGVVQIYVVEFLDVWW